MAAAAALGGAGLASASASASASTTVVGRYVTGGATVADTGVVYASCVTSAADAVTGVAAPTVGGVCGPADVAGRTVSITVADAVSPTVAAHWFTSGPGGDVEGVFCGSTVVSVPADAYGITVSPVAETTPVVCPGAGVPTTGTVTFVVS